jgi:hypothetical protein
VAALQPRRRDISITAIDHIQMGPWRHIELERVAARRVRGCPDGTWSDRDPGRKLLPSS